MARKKNLAYYELIDNIINKCFQQIKIEGLKDKDMLIKNKKKYDEDLPMYRAEVVLDQNQSSETDAQMQLTEIKGFFKKFENL